MSTRKYIILLKGYFRLDFTGVFLYFALFNGSHRLEAMDNNIKRDKALYMTEIFNWYLEGDIFLE